MKVTREQLAEDYPDILFCDGLDEALLGVAHRFGMESVALYDRKKCIEIFMRDMRCDEGECAIDEPCQGECDHVHGMALEHFDFNVIGAWVGDLTPIFADLEGSAMSLDGTIRKIRDLADGRRHYDGTDDYTCFDALGDVRALCDAALKDEQVTPQEAPDGVGEFYLAQGLEEEPGEETVRISGGYGPDGPLDQEVDIIRTFTPEEHATTAKAAYEVINALLACGAPSEQLRGAANVVLRRLSV